MGDRRCADVSERVQVAAVTKPVSGVARETNGGSHEVVEAVEWVLVAWPGLLATAKELLGKQVECRCCGRRGRVARVVERDDIWSPRSGLG